MLTLSFSGARVSKPRGYLDYESGNPKIGRGRRNNSKRRRHYITFKFGIECNQSEVKIKKSVKLFIPQQIVIK